MESKKNIIAYLRQKQGLTQEELAEKLFVTRQAVSRWETGETTPNAERWHNSTVACKRNKACFIP